MTAIVLPSVQTSEVSKTSEVLGVTQGDRVGVSLCASTYRQ
jgi:hypothetical protein